MCRRALVYSSGVDSSVRTGVAEFAGVRVMVGEGVFVAVGIFVKVGVIEGV
jgi:hypothetical protein